MANRCFGHRHHSPVRLNRRHTISALAVKSIVRWPAHSEARKNIAQGGAKFVPKDGRLPESSRDVAYGTLEHLYTA